jgi:hypothetical protein
MHYRHGAPGKRTIRRRRLPELKMCAQPVVSIVSSVKEIREIPDRQNKRLLDPDWQVERFAGDRVLGDPDPIGIPQSEWLNPGFLAPPEGRPDIMLSQALPIVLVPAMSGFAALLSAK